MSAISITFISKDWPTKFKTFVCRVLFFRIPKFMLQPAVPNSQRCSTGQSRASITLRSFLLVLTHSFLPYLQFYNVRSSAGNFLGGIFILYVAFLCFSSAFDFRINFYFRTNDLRRLERHTRTEWIKITFFKWNNNLNCFENGPFSVI